ncbi:MAG: sporulation transcriptional regulator SpoIIID [Huintestinicola sp.]|uniref:sporulation transcriptional regulator SpoIIID n=1 Tax=Huintestinicola sp. TaxID=2981661 RepID=UPI003EFFCE92
MSELSFDDKKERAVILGEYIIERKATVRAAAKAFGISKSTVHKDITEKLPHINSGIYKEAKKILETNKRERHIRGGMATKHKYEEMHKKNN